MQHKSYALITSYGFQHTLLRDTFSFHYHPLTLLSLFDVVYYCSILHKIIWIGVLADFIYHVKWNGVEWLIQECDFLSSSFFCCVVIFIHYCYSILQKIVWIGVLAEFYHMKCRSIEWLTQEHGYHIILKCVASSLLSLLHKFGTGTSLHKFDVSSSLLLIINVFCGRSHGSAF